MDKKDMYTIYRGVVFRYDDYGNYNYGVAARAFGLPLELALFGAGMYQVFKGDGKPDWSNKRGYFDHKNDTPKVIRGFYHVFK